MRIRTIKPEFWTHPVMSRQRPDTQLLAIALLNYADDEGYFYADPDMVRGAIRFREDSTNIRRSIDELSNIGYLSIREHPTHGEIGRIVAFNQHQRVDRGKPSEIRKLFDSTNDRRLIDEESTLEQGTGNREQVKESIKTVQTAEADLPKPELDIEFKCINGTYKISNDFLDTLKATYSNTDLLQELKQARIWLEANAARRKTVNGMPRFIIGWLQKAKTFSAPVAPVPVRSFNGFSEARETKL